MEGDSAENEGIASVAEGLALPECPAQEPFSEILLPAAKSAMENPQLLDSLHELSLIHI